MEVSPAALSTPASRPLTTTERNWLAALAIVVGGTLLTALVLWVEKQMGVTNRSERLVGNAVESFMRFLALPHFLLAILFMSTSRGMRTPRAWIWFVGLTGLGVGLCFAFGHAGGRAAYLPNALFLTYFLVHEFRDQAFFYRANGDVPGGTDAGTMRWDLLRVPLLGLAAIAAAFLMGSAFSIGGARRYTEAVYGSTPVGLRYALGVLAVVLVAGACHLTKRSWDKRYEGGALGFVRLHRPLFFVFGGILAVLVLDIILNGRAYAIVTLHVAAWYVFVTRGFAKRPAPNPVPKAGTWRWMRSTRRGFLYLHNGLFVVIVAAAVLWAYGFHNSSEQSALWVLLSKDAFPYWTIMHVTISFVPR
ncbi:MAG: hypothetical protein QNJ98_15705 [Planctomycetota bacterium]|nr:hypothetical protein [Planctomycetota bacterium]